VVNLQATEGNLPEEVLDVDSDQVHRIGIEIGFGEDFWEND